MRRTIVPLLAALSLSACGADDHAANDGGIVNAGTAPSQGASSSFVAVEPLVSLPAGDQPASTPAAAAEQSLAADSQQITPVLHYPPDSAN